MLGLAVAGAEKLPPAVALTDAVGDAVAPVGRL